MATQRKAPASFDRMPPQNIDAERSVLGAMLLNSEAVGTAIEILRENAADVFYSEKHQHIYGAMVSLYRNDTPIDGVTLVEQLTRDGQLEPVGGPSYIADLAGAVPTSANVEFYARIVLDAAVLRRVISACTRLAGEAYSLPSDVNQLLDQAEQAIFSISETRQLNPIFKVVDLIPEAID
ncbi:MAG: replicative DNA helicase, partial [Candidatus Hydrogenedentes bacterium]|nr:replicative DNA helicase [Candidatus Hydrogenedentota bacterium]